MAAQNTCELSVVIVTFNSERHIGPCLRSLLTEVNGLQAEIIVVDNASTDRTCGIVEKLALEAGTRLQVFRNERNVGFTKATNLGLSRAHGRYLLLLNPDVEVPPGAVRWLLRHLAQSPAVGIVAPQLRFPDGRVQPSCRRFPRRRDVLCEVFGLSRLFPHSARLNAWKMAEFDHLTPREVDQPQGAFLLARREAVASVGLLDERFVIVFRPDVYAIHHKGASVYAHRVGALVASHRDFVRYFRKYPSRWPLVDVFVSAVLFATLWPRLAWALISRWHAQRKGGL